MNIPKRQKGRSNMRLKYFMRGLGSGIVLTTVVLALTMKAPSDAQIIERATKLGMVKEEEGLSTEELADLKDKSDNNLEKADTTKENISSETDSNSENKTDGSEDSTEAEKTTDSNNTSKETDKSNATANANSENKDVAEDTVANTDEKADEDKNTSSKKEKIVIYKGMHSYSVARMLEEHGIIDNAKDFDKYLIEAGFQYRIQQGTYQLKASTSYDQIIEVIIK